MPALSGFERIKGWWKKLGSGEEGPEPPPAGVSSRRSTNEDGGAGSEPSRRSSQPSTLAEQQPAAPAPPQPAQPPAAPAPQATSAAQPVAQPQAQRPQQQERQQAPSNPPANGGKAMLDTRDFFADAVHAEANRYTIKEVIGKGSYGVVCSAVDNFTGEKVAIKKITNVFEHVSDATRIVREIKLLRLLKHPDIVDIKHIMLPPSPKDFKDIYVVFELLETDLHQVIKANDDLTPEHHQFFLYQMLRGLKYIHSAKVFHRDLKPKNILANSDCKLKICDFGLARPAFNDMPTTVFWTDYVATRWYRAPELCGSFFAKYSPAIDIWSVGCIFAEVLLGKPLFPGRNVVNQLELITDLLGTPTAEVIAKVRNEKSRRFLLNMRPKPGVPFEQHFPRADKGALKLLKRLLAFDPAERPTAEEALADPYFTGLHCLAREPVSQPISKLAFEFDRRKLALEDVRELIYREILEYHPQMLKEYASGVRPSFHYPSALESFKRQFAHLEGGGAPIVRGQGTQRIYPSSSLPKEWVADFQAEAAKYVSHGGAVSGGGAGGANGDVYGNAPAGAYESPVQYQEEYDVAVDEQHLLQYDPGMAGGGGMVGHGHGGQMLHGQGHGHGLLPHGQGGVLPASHAYAQQAQQQAVYAQHAGLTQQQLHHHQQQLLQQQAHAVQAAHAHAAAQHQAALQQQARHQQAQALIGPAAAAAAGQGRATGAAGAYHGHGTGPPQAGPMGLRSESVSR